MRLPFTIEQFFAVFAAYNAAIWPAQIAAYGLGLAVVGMLLWDSMIGKRLILFILAGIWAWNGIVYHFGFFTSINPMGRGFSALFLLQAILLVASATRTNDLRFKVRRDLRSTIGLSLILYALLIYEVIGYASGHGMMKGPVVRSGPVSDHDIYDWRFAFGKW